MLSYSTIATFLKLPSLNESIEQGVTTLKKTLYYGSCKTLGGGGMLFFFSLFHCAVVFKELQIQSLQPSNILNFLSNEDNLLYEVDFKPTLFFDQDTKTCNL